TGQARSIRSAMARAAVDPVDIGLVEAHGAGTQLGDSIEYKALVRAFATKARSYCALGSVKTNLGHTDCASGLAGLIKVVMAMRQQTLPASLHFERPNPEIDLVDGPFYLITEPEPWDPAGSRRIALVGALGIGGTNAHVVVGAAPERPAAPTREQYHVL